MAFTACMEIREMLLHLFICEEQELREKWSNQDQNHPLYERMCQVASTWVSRYVTSRTRYICPSPGVNMKASESSTPSLLPK